MSPLINECAETLRIEKYTYVDIVNNTKPLISAKGDS